MGIDPGGAEQGNNKTAIVLCLRTEDNELIVYKSWLLNKKGQTPDGTGYFDDIYQICKEYKVQHAVFETMTGAYQTVFDSLYAYFVEMDRKTGGRVSTIFNGYSDNQRSKSQRLFPFLKGFIELDHFYFVGRNNEDEVFDVFDRQVKGLSAGGRSEDDLLDGIYLSQQMVTKPSRYNPMLVNQKHQDISRDDILKRMSGVKVR
jgi:hypothetical protein